MEEDFSPQQSLQVIQSMIHKTKINLAENRFYFLLWGWVSLAAIIAQFLLKVVFESPYHYAVWSVTLVALVITIIRSSRDHRNPKVRTYIGDAVGYLWMGLGIAFFIVTFVIMTSRNAWQHVWPLYISFYGLGTFVSGKILRFPPLAIGGLFNFVLAVVAVFVHFDYQLLIGAAAILTSYIIPGHLLKENSSDAREEIN